jgi:hypothetical protein
VSSFYVHHDILIKIQDSHPHVTELTFLQSGLSTQRRPRSGSPRRSNLNTSISPLLSQTRRRWRLHTSDTSSLGVLDQCSSSNSILDTLPTIVFRTNSHRSNSSVLPCQSHFLSILSTGKPSYSNNILAHPHPSMTLPAMVKMKRLTRPFPSATGINETAAFDLKRAHENESRPLVVLAYALCFHNCHTVRYPSFAGM